LQSTPCSSSTGIAAGAGGGSAISQRYRIILGAEPAIANTSRQYKRMIPANRRCTACGRLARKSHDSVNQITPNETGNARNANGNPMANHSQFAPPATPALPTTGRQSRHPK
jgi:hypothetical protein